MKYEFVSRIMVNKKDEHKVQNIFLTIGICGFVLSIIIELIIGNKVGLVFVVPLLYLISLKRGLKKQVYMKPIMVVMDFKDDGIVIFLKGNGIDKKASELKYEILYTNIKNCIYERKFLALTMEFKGIEYNGKRKKFLLNKTLTIILPEDKEKDVIEQIKRRIFEKI